MESLEKRSDDVTDKGQTHHQRQRLLLNGRRGGKCAIVKLAKIQRQRHDGQKPRHRRHSRAAEEYATARVADDVDLIMGTFSKSFAHHSAS